MELCGFGKVAKQTLAKAGSLVRIVLQKKNGENSKGSRGKDLGH